jgi:oligoribonuclease
MMLAWMDLEMTGLDPREHVILEVATIITDDELNILAEGPDLVIHATDDELSRMNEVVLAMHQRSGLLQAVRESTTSLQDAQSQTLEFLKQWIPEPHSAPLCGNTIGMDRRFLAVYMPEVDEYLHYRCIDVSSIKELCRRWYPSVTRKVSTKRGHHRAMDDIQDSIAELVAYRGLIFVPPNSLEAPETLSTDFSDGDQSNSPEAARPGENS